ncbi:MAG: ABC transporter permease [Bryobacteraceae bacterium]|nr:ABC transporter permease [Bryobacteraceae bacterium]MDW8377327.1 ABC transporter permease [Bryobacterales bacterium]
MNRLRSYFLAPAVFFLVLLFVTPLGIILGYSLLSRGAYGGVELPVTVENYLRLFDPLYALILIRSVAYAAIATLVCLLLGFPLALFIARSQKHKTLFLALVVIPFWTSFLVRTYAWMFLLRDTGLINFTLQRLGILSEPLPLLYNAFAVVLGLVYGYLPFMVLPIYAALEKLDRAVLEAAADLGARPFEALWRVTLPLSMPGIRAGTVLVFISCLGSYLTPDLLGGGKTIMIGTLIQNQFTSARNWPFGSALSLVLMAIVMLMVLSALRRQEDRL